MTEHMFENPNFEFPPRSFDELDLTAHERGLIHLPPETGFAPIPRGLDRMVPGPVLAALLATIDVRRVSGRDRVTVPRARQRLASHVQAASYRDMFSISEFFEAEDPDVEFCG